ncbi:hypothetical protein SDC9_209608 [bioreactor metagenome]|uniref:Uncharacterized protein n=1 Tax=bioreactor metagenome TaxID=1076179 RepID=A0A645JQR3_9ZZZZ
MKNYLACASDATYLPVPSGGGHYLPDHCPDLFDRKIIKRNAIDGMTTEETVKTEKSRQYQSFLFSSNIYYISLSSTIISLIIILPLSDTMNSNG